VFFIVAAYTYVS